MFVSRCGIGLLIASWISLSAFATNAPAQQSTHSRSIAVPHVAQKPLEVVNGSGDVEVRKADGNEVRIRAEIKANSPQRAKSVKILAEREDDGTLRVRLDWPEGGRKPLESASVRVDVPDVLEISAKTDAGGIRLAGLAGEARLQTLNGGIDVRGFKGRLEFDFRNGEAQIRDVDGQIVGKGVNGGASLSGIAGPVRIETTNGRMDVRLKPESGGPVDLKTTNGGIDLTVGKGFAGSIRAKCMNGNVDIELPGLIKSMKQERFEQLVELNAPGDDSTLAATNGHVRVRLAD